jgi:hypothetical protein
MQQSPGHGRGGGGLFTLLLGDFQSGRETGELAAQPFHFADGSSPGLIGVGSRPVGDSRRGDRLLAPLLFGS